MEYYIIKYYEERATKHERVCIGDEFYIKSENPISLDLTPHQKENLSKAYYNITLEKITEGEYKRRTEI